MSRHLRRRWRFSYSLPGLLLKQTRAGAGALAVLALIVLLLSGLAAAAPLALRALTTAEIGYQADGQPAIKRDLTATAHGGPVLTAGAGLDQFQTMDIKLEQVRSKQPQPLRGVMGKVQWVSVAGSVQAGYTKGGPDDPPIAMLALTVAPGFEDQVHVSEGTAPTPFTGKLSSPEGDPRPDLSILPGWKQPIDVMLAKTVADRMQWKVGDSRLAGVNGSLVPFRLSGTFIPRDTGGDYWSVLPLALEPSITHTPPTQDYTEIDTASAFIDPGSWPAIQTRTGRAFPLITAVRYPFDTTGLDVAKTEALLPQLTHFLAGTYSIGTSSIQDDETVSTLQFESSVAGSLAAALQRGSTASAVVAMAVAGPIGVAVAVLWLLVRLLVQRRRDSLALARARGAAGWQVRGVLALEALIVSVPAAAIGVILAGWLLPVRLTLGDLLFPALVALTPGVLVALTASARAVRHGRSDLNPRSARRTRWITEVVVLALTALSVVLLWRRGLSAATTNQSVDPLLAAVPLLLALSTAVIVLRVYPLPLLAAARLLHRTRGVVAFLGAARIVRDPAAGLAPVLALLVGVSVTVFTGVLLTTVDSGVQDAAASEVGADVRLSGADMTPEQLAQISALPGVEKSVSVSMAAAPVNAGLSSGTRPVIVFVADTDALRSIQSGIPGTATLPAGMNTAPDDEVPVVFANPLAYQGKTLAFGHVTAKPVGSIGTSDSITTLQEWAIADVSMVKRLQVNLAPQRLAFVKTEPGADAAAIAAKATAILGTGSQALLQPEVAQRLLGSPVSHGLQWLLLAMVAAVALLCAGAVLLAMMISAAARAKLLSLLRIVGLSSRQSRGILGWEAGPSALVAVVVGLGLGMVLTLVVLAGVDLRAFTGGAERLRVSVNPLVLTAITGGFVLIVVAVSAVAMAAVRRVNLARSLRTGEEG